MDVLVNNAGIYPDEGVNILTVSRDLLTKTMNTNAFSPIGITQAFISLTDMGGSSAPRTPEQVADTAIWLATKASMIESGKFFRNRTEQPY